MVARLQRLSRLDPELRECCAQPADLAWIGQGEHAVDLLQRACERFAQRTCLQTHQASISYGQLWSRANRLAGAMRDRLGVRPQERVGLCGFGSIDWVVADLACLIAGAVSVPMSHRVSVQEAGHVMQQTGAVCLLVEGAELTRLAGLVETTISLDTPVEGYLSISELEFEAGDQAVECWHPEEPSTALHSIVYTSGSTGQPKGVMLPYSRWTSTMRDAVKSRTMSRLALGYLPLSHMAGRITVYKQLMTGGKLGFVAEQDRSDLLAEVRYWRPTHLLLVPRVSQLFYQRFQTLYFEQGGKPQTDVSELLRSKLGRQVCRQMRHELFGGRLSFVHTGAAPTASEVRTFLEQGLDLHVTDVYGSTEMGPVAVNGQVHTWVKYKLVDRPELGFTRKDRPYPRGELAILSPRGTPGYYNDDGASEELRDLDGYVLSGDIVEERGPGQLVWLDRSKSVLRLAHGKFVNVSMLEELYPARSPYLEQVYLHGNPFKSHLLAVVVPSSLLPQKDRKRWLRDEFARVAQEAGLAPHEVPRDFLIREEPFTQENGLLSGANKLRRPRLKQAFAEELERLEEEIDRRREVGSAVKGTPLEQVEVAVARLLGVSQSEIAGRSFVALGGDSLAAVQLVEELERRCGLKLSVSRLLDPTSPLEALISQPPEERFSLLHGDGPLLASQLRLSNFGEVASRPEPREDSSPPCVLLTGANGFLGRSLCLALMERCPEQGRLICLVRGADDEQARERLTESFSSGPARADWDRWLQSGRVEVVAGDLALPDLGLSPERYRRLGQELSSILHAGALVNHRLDYRNLFAPNVLGTHSLIRLAMNGQARAFHYVSTAGLAAGLPRGGAISEEITAAELWPRREREAQGYAHGYVSSKWAAEVLLEDFHRETGLALTISRCSMLLPSRRYPREFNPEDTFSRLFWGILKTGLAPRSFYSGRHPRRHYDGLPVDLVADFLSDLAWGRPQGRRIYHVSNSQWDDKISLDQMVDWAEALGPITRLPYQKFFARFQEALERLPAESQRARSPLSLLEHWRQPQKGREVTSRLQTDAFAQSLRQPIPSLDRDYILQCLKVLSEEFPTHPQTG